MNKKIIILNGGPRKRGNTAKLIQAFTEGAESSGNKVSGVFLEGMNINGCKGCMGANHNPRSPCTQKDDMTQIYQEFEEADVVVFASPVYFWTISGQLKIAADRLYAELECLGYEKFAKDCVLIMTSGGGGFAVAEAWYNNYERNLGWKNLGTVLGSGKTEEARKLGGAIS